MKRIKIKRLMYRNMNTGETYYGAEEYDSTLTDNNILGAIFHKRKHQWTHSGNSIYQVDTNGTPVYHITVETFYQYQKSWYDKIMDTFRQ